VIFGPRLPEYLRDSRTYILYEFIPSTKASLKELAPLTLSYVLACWGEEDERGKDDIEQAGE